MPGEPSRTRPVATKPCGPTALFGWSPPASPADTRARRLVDTYFLGSIPTVVTFVLASALVNIAPHVATLVQFLLLTAVASLLAGGWCATNFWRCRQAHCLIDGIGWLALAAFSLVEAAIGRSFTGDNEGTIFTAVLVVSLGFEFIWTRTHGTNAVGRA